MPASKFIVRKLWEYFAYEDPDDGLVTALANQFRADGLNIGLLVEIPGRMAEGDWRVAAYVDERATQKAYNGILKILSGTAGGTTGLFTKLVSTIIGAECSPV